MPIFSRRRLHSMLTELSILVPASKANDLIARLEHVDTDAALGAEAELSMLWAISQVAHLVVEPTLPDSNRVPDAWSDNLIGTASAAIEIAALSDDSFSGNNAMKRTANIISSYANSISKDAGRHLSFEFLERSYWDKRFYRERLVDPAFELSENTKRQLQTWIANRNKPTRQRIRIAEEKTDIVLTWHEAPLPRVRVFSKMPPVAYDLEDNPVFRTLKKKSRQLKGAGAETLRAVLMVDAGCNLLRTLRRGGMVMEISGEEIVRHALRKLSIDLVLVCSPFREPPQILSPNRSNLYWKVTCFDGRQDVPENDYQLLEKMAGVLPKPRFEGYQARAMHKDGQFEPQQRGWYSGTTITSDKGVMTIKISSRLVQEYLAGRFDAATFQNYAFGGDENVFDRELSRGRTIQGIRFERGGVDRDDDFLVFDMDFDWGAKAFRDP